MSQQTPDNRQLILSIFDEFEGAEEMTLEVLEEPTSALHWTSKCQLCGSILACDSTRIPCEHGALNYDLLPPEGDEDVTLSVKEGASCKESLLTRVAREIPMSVTLETLARRVTVRCMVCERKLMAPKSLERKMGPVCYGKMRQGWASVQVHIDDYLGSRGREDND